MSDLPGREHPSAMERLRIRWVRSERGGLAPGRRAFAWPAPPAEQGIPGARAQDKGETRMPRRALTLVVGAVIVIVLGAIPANAQQPQVLRQDDTVAGRTVNAWVAPYAKWNWERFKPTNCQAGQRGRMFFLPASGPGNHTASCTVDVGTPVMATPATLLCSGVRDVPTCLDPQVQHQVKQAGVKIDGVPLRVRPRDWVTKSGFSMGGGPGAAAGYYYVLDGLSVGTHTIVLFTRVRPPGQPAFRSRMTITLVVR
jgi:hypothetical protein